MSSQFSPHLTSSQDIHIFHTFISTLLLELRLGGWMHILIKTPDEKTMSLEVNISETIKSVKTKIQDKEGIPLLLQSLFFAGNELKDDYTFSEYQVYWDFTLELVLTNKESQMRFIVALVNACGDLDAFSQGVWVNACNICVWWMWLMEVNGGIGLKVGVCLKALDEGFFSKNYVRKFLRALHPKRITKVTSLKESKDLSSLALDDLIGNLKVHEVIMEKDFEIYKGKKEREEVILKKDDKKGKCDRKCLRCSDPNHLIGKCPKPSRNKDQKAFVAGSWSDSENEDGDKTNEETCLMAQSSNEVTLDSSFYSDNVSSLDDDAMQIEYNNLYELSLELIEDDDVPLFDGVLEGALGAFGDLGCCCGDGVFESSLVRSMNNFLGGISVIFGFLEILEVEA
ncbi:zf-CCHC domain-containing protein [Tanacetum coccineum]